MLSVDPVADPVGSLDNDWMGTTLITLDLLLEAYCRELNGQQPRGEKARNSA